MAAPRSRADTRALAWAGVGLLLATFAALAIGVRDAGTLPFDLPLLVAARDMAGGVLDAPSALVSKLGHESGVVPFDILLVLALLLARRMREAVFAAIALAGSGLLNMAAKRVFARERPALWESIAPEHTFSFPSGHAMGSMTLAAVLVLLAWPTRWRWPVLAVLALFVALVGLSRVHLGVHYPSDVLAGWSLALAWAVATYLLVFRTRARPWTRASRRP